MKAVVYNLIYKVFYFIFFIKFYLLVFRKNRVIVFDIDNTVADTWPSFLINHKSDKERLSNLTPFKNVVNLILKYCDEGHKIVFMTARDYRHYIVTKIWLKKNVVNKFDLILVSSPFEKIKLLSKFNKKQFIFYDDLSHSHEKGSVLFYEGVLKELRKLNNVKHIGYDELVNIQKGGLL